MGYYLGIFAYTTMGSLIGSLIAGIIYDYERKRYSGMFLISQNIMKTTKNKNKH